jgi:hypothetical protein
MPTISIPMKIREIVIENFTIVDKIDEIVIDRVCNDVTIMERNNNVKTIVIIIIIDMRMKSGSNLKL